MNIREPLSVRVAGIGGQGNILAGKLLAQAAVFDGKHVVQTQLYGAQVRGGISHCDIIICDDWIDFPEASQFDVMYIMHLDALKAYQKLLRPNGVILMDSTFVETLPQSFHRTRKVLMIPLEKLAIEKFGTPMVSNMIGLGALVKSTQIVTIDSLIKSVHELISEKYTKLNIEAINYGYQTTDKEFKLKSEQKVRTIGFE
ncbi:2-oxoacid:acceptor oxidoreductase family protein [Thermotoga profunda]|uniref:2-oxoacid:acceptor oxidoreductase family protein n=1 Tax=Thermotoga profunda TaxID=1508420 RepID=UPI0006936DBF|nr:2-oxoacid:acceptor oxidoreductase family protein [Thermotoga profunda]